jgi:hypothetical protein
MLPPGLTATRFPWLSNARPAPPLGIEANVLTPPFGLILETVVVKRSHTYRLSEPSMTIEYA